LRPESDFFGTDFNRKSGPNSMFNHHAALALVQLTISAILVTHGETAEALCVLIAAAIYAVMPPDQ
jgi:hypothetical protein